jgi:hypothetical protein
MARFAVRMREDAAAFSCVKIATAGVKFINATVELINTDVELSKAVVTLSGAAVGGCVAKEKFTLPSWDLTLPLPKMC